MKAKQLMVVTYDIDLRPFSVERLFREVCDSDKSQYKQGKTFSKVK